MDKLPNEGVLFNRDGKLEYQLTEKKNSSYDKKQRRFEIRIYKLIKVEKIENGVRKKYANTHGIVMTLPENNFMSFLKEMGYLNSKESSNNQNKNKNEHTKENTQKHNG